MVTIVLGAGMFVALTALIASILAAPSALRATQRTDRAAPLYRSSVVGTDFDFITQDDRDSFEALEFIGIEPFEMPDKRNSKAPLVRKAYLFAAHFREGSSIRIALDEDFGSRESAEREARRYVSPLGKLPVQYRRKLNHMVVHKGGADTTSFAEDKGHFFVVYSGNAEKRVGTHDLEETIFHEATHAAIQADYLDGKPWARARRLDNAFITDYARGEEQEDFAESALFAYTLIMHPDRFPDAERARIEDQIPNRIAFFRTIYGRR